MSSKPATLEQIQAFLAGEPVPEQPAHDPAYLWRVGPISGADAATVVFAADAATLASALSSAAGAILTSSRAVQGLENRHSLQDPRMILAADPRLAFAQVYWRWFAVKPAERIHPSSTLGKVSRGVGCSIGPGCVLEDGVLLGDHCVLGARVTLHEGTTLGHRVTVQAGAVLGSSGFGYARGPNGYVGFPQIGTLVVEDDVEIGANTTIDRGALGETRIGRGTKIDNLVHIAHNCRIGQHVVIAAQVGIAGSTVVADGAILGGQVGLAEHVEIGPGLIIGAQAGVPTGKRLTGKPGQVFWGTPARPIEDYLRDLAHLKAARARRAAASAN